MNDVQTTRGNGTHTPAADPSFAEMYPTLAALGRRRPRMLADFERALRIARRFRREHIEPNALAIDRAVMRDPTHVAEEIIAAAAHEGLFGMTVPKAFGGGGMSFGTFIVALEEIGAGCLGLANLIGVHGLAIATVAATGDVGAMAKVSRALTDGERAGRPALLSTAITEPSAGTDVEDVDLLRTARLTCEARPVRGGYRLRGSKVFISNGSIARTHVVIMPTNRERPVETTFAFLVPSDTKGFSVGRIEHKMGQKACPAAELVFDDCFVPETARLNSKALPGRRIELVLGATRGGVAAWGAAVARGAYERALAYAETHEIDGARLVDHQWVQIKLADMARNVMLARACYVEATLSNELFGLSSLVSGGGMQDLARVVPQRLLDSTAVRSLLVSRRAREGFQASIERLDARQLDTASAHGAAAKVSATDIGMANCHIALDVLGADGLRHDQGVEKLYRDAKLLQIYEGTNQLNRLEVYKRAVHRKLERGEPPPRPSGAAAREREMVRGQP
jgi:acyl-CoA dehydrogenase